MSKFRDKQFVTDGSIYPFLKRLFSYSKKYKKWMRGFILFVLFVAATEAITPLVWLNLLDNAIVPLVEQYKPSYENGVTPDVDFGPLTKYVLILVGLGSIIIIFGFHVYKFCRKAAGVHYV
ncbi:MAG: hypothetical protein R3A12_10555 [Ignavibacteria bacterium]